MTDLKHCSIWTFSNQALIAPLPHIMRQCEYFSQCNTTKYHLYAWGEKVQMFWVWPKFVSVYDYDVIYGWCKRPPHAEADKGEDDDYGRSHRRPHCHSQHLECKIVNKCLKKHKISEIFNHLPVQLALCAIVVSSARANPRTILDRASAWKP